MHGFIWLQKPSCLCPAYAKSVFVSKDTAVRQIDSDETKTFEATHLQSGSQTHAALDFRAPATRDPGRELTHPRSAELLIRLALGQPVFGMGYAPLRCLSACQRFSEGPPFVDVLNSQQACTGM